MGYFPSLINDLREMGYFLFQLCLTSTNSIFRQSPGGSILQAIPPQNDLIKSLSQIIANLALR